ncbi:MAG: hypothetical protein ABJC13_08420 [Acidobacteriota bacterium]
MIEVAQPFGDWLPEKLRQTAFWHGTEAAWQGGDASLVIQAAGKAEVAVIGVEIWIPDANGPRIPQPFFYAWTATKYDRQSPWSAYYLSVNHQAASFTARFNWDTRDLHHFGVLPWFNLTPAGREDLS